MLVAKLLIPCEGRRFIGQFQVTFSLCFNAFLAAEYWKTLKILFPNLASNTKQI